MFSACSSCYTNFTTPRALKRHKTRYHPNTREEQIMCKACNMPFSDQYYFKRHNAKYHNGKVSTMAISYMGAKQNKDYVNVQSIKEDYTEKLLNLEKINRETQILYSKIQRTFLKSLKSQRS